MSLSESAGADRTVLFCLHYLGGSANEWQQVARSLGERIDVIAIDLPGFGDAAQRPGYTVADMAHAVAATIAATAPRRWMVAGHSMGAKVATAIARRAEDGAPEMSGLSGIITIAGSPPSPEPIPDADREMMLGWFGGDTHGDRADAERYIANNTGPEIDATSRGRAVADVLRMNRNAWRAWLTSGSREDWSQRVGVLQTPALVIAGALDPNLGPDAQRRLMVPQFAHARVLTVPNAKHLLPLEAADAIAQAMGEHVHFADYRTLIASNRVGSATRTALLERAAPDPENAAGAVLGASGLATLRAAIDCVIPQPEDRRIDLAARIDRQLASSGGDGWRFADLPPDADAYRAGLQTLDDAAHQLHGRAFAALDVEARQEMLAAIADGRFQTASSGASETLDGANMKRWFEDLRGDAVKLYVSHPDTLARMGYSGIANGGDGRPKSGFARVGIGEREAWEPVAMPDRQP